MPYELHKSFNTDCIFDRMLDKQHNSDIYSCPLYMNSLEKNFSFKCSLGHTVHATMWVKSQVQSTGSFCLFLHLHNSVTNGKKLEEKT